MRQSNDFYLSKLCLFTSPSRHNTPRFTCKKKQRPATKFVKKRVTEACSLSSSLSTPEAAAQFKTDEKRKEPTGMLNKNSHEYDVASGLSSDGGFDVGGNLNAKLCSVVDKLQDHDW